MIQIGIDDTPMKFDRTADVKIFSLKSLAIHELFSHYTSIP